MKTRLARRAGLGIVGLLAAGVWIADIYGLPQAPRNAGNRGNNRRRANDKVFGEPTDPVTAIPGIRLTDDAAYDNQPAAAVAADGTPWVAWVRYVEGRGDEVVVSSVKDGKASSPVALSPAPGQYIRPVLAAAGNDVWCAWTSSHPDSVSTIEFTRRTGDAWSPAARLLPDEKRGHQNPEIAATSDGRVAIAYQAHNGTDYDIHLRMGDAKGWSAIPPAALSDASTDDWDPAVAFDAKGNLHVVWSGFRDGDYDVYESHASNASYSSARRISARGIYDLHPWIAPAPDGSLWVSWDSVDVPNHGRSGGTTITGANLRGNEDRTHGKAGNRAGVEVRVLSPDGTVRVPGNPFEEIAAPKGYLLAHCTVPKVAFGPKGEPWVVYRVLRREAETPGIGYFWELMARPFRGGHWGNPVRFAEADGYLEESATATAPDGIRVAYGGEHRRTHIPHPGASEGRRRAGPETKNKPESNKDEDKPDEDPGDAAAAQAAAATADHHRDFDRRIGWKGDLYIASLGADGGSGPAITNLPEEKAPADEKTDSYLPRGSGRREATVGGTTYHLLWGDTHRHSNVSRCSAGGEPSPDDRYRYGTDICRYDFFALSDHAEDPRVNRWEVIDYYWWKQQKLADLYHLPGFMSVLYNLEWSMHFPSGHHNTIFPSRPTFRLDSRIAASSTLAGGWKILEDQHLKAITIPHTGADPGMGTAWEVQDDRYQRLCEIFQSCRGSYEHSGCPREFNETSNKKGFYWNALEKGYHVGIIASSDHGYGCAYACAYATANTRDAVWQALWDRRTYGATTYGLVLDLRSGDHWMGEEWKSKEAPKLELYVRGAAPIRSIEILGRSKVLYAEGSVKKPLNVSEKTLSWSDPDWAKQTKEQWYYVRVIQTDDEMAWSSPVWVIPLK